MQEYCIGTTVVGFDGTVLEVFGTAHVHRYHLYHIRELQLSQSRSGRYSLYINAQGGQGTPAIGIDHPDSLPIAQALIDAVNAARQSRGMPPVSS